MTTITTASITSSAPASAFFDRWADTATWPEWDRGVQWIELHGPFEVGTTGRLKPVNGPQATFTITALSDTEFVDVSRVPGGRITFTHTVCTDHDGTHVRVSVDVDGPLGFVWSRILGRKFRAHAQPSLEALATIAESDVATR
ncbi:MAG: SRPBCC family protein [Nocardioides sp.]